MKHNKFEWIFLLSRRFHKLHTNMEDVKLVKVGEGTQVSPQKIINQRVVCPWNLWRLFFNLVFFVFPWKTLNGLNLIPIRDWMNQRVSPNSSRSFYKNTAGNCILKIIIQKLDRAFLKRWRAFWKSSWWIGRFSLTNWSIGFGEFVNWPKWVGRFAKAL